MAKTRDYMDYLDERIEIAPANSQEEYQAAETIADLMRDHGLETSIDEFEAYPLAILGPAALSIALFVCLLITGLTEGVVHVVTLLLALTSVAVLLVCHYLRNIFETFGPASRSQNVVGVHRATGDKVVKGARPIVVVAHYDTPRESLLRKGALARSATVLRRASVPCAIAAAVALFVQVLAFLPAVVRTFVWVVGLLACVPLLLVAVAAIVDRNLACTMGANDNKASVAALLAIMDKVRPGDDRATGDEDRPQRRRATDAPPAPPEPRLIEVVEEVHGVRHGADVLSSLGILPPSCEVVYEEPKVRVIEEATPDHDDELQEELTEELPKGTVPNGSEAEETADDEDDETEPEETADDEAAPAEEPAVRAPLPPARRRSAGRRVPVVEETDDDYDEDKNEADDDYEDYDEYDDYDEEIDYDEDEWDDDEPAEPSAIGTWFSERIASLRERFSSDRGDDVQIERGEDRITPDDDDEWELSKGTVPNGEAEPSQLGTVPFDSEEELEDADSAEETDTDYVEQFDDDFDEYDEEDDYDEENDYDEDDDYDDEPEPEPTEEPEDDYDEWLDDDYDDYDEDDEPVEAGPSLGARIRSFFHRLLPEGAVPNGEAEPSQLGTVPSGSADDSDYADAELESWEDVYEDAEAVEDYDDEYDEYEDADEYEDEYDYEDDYDDEYEQVDESDEDSDELEPSDTGLRDEQYPAELLEDPNSLHIDREEDADILPRDTTGLDTISDSYDLYSDEDVDVEQHAKPEPVDDPNWGVSSFTPARPAINIARRAALFDLPDPSAATVDPLADDDEYEEYEEYDEYEEYEGESVEELEDEPYEDVYEAEATDESYDDDRAEEAYEDIEDTDDYEDADTDEQRDDELPVDTTGQTSFWKGGATVRADLRDDEGDEPIVIDEDDLQDAILELGDEFLVAHDIWFVATGASEVDHAGIKAFLDDHRRDIRGAFLVNLDSVGAGTLTVLAREGLHAPRRADRRLVRMIRTIAEDLHIGLDTAVYDGDETESASATRARVRSVTIMGMDDNDLPALSHTADDVPENVDPGQVSSVVRIVTELIRRS